MAAPQAERDAAVLMYLSGASLAKTAKRIGYHPDTIARWVREAGHDVRRPGGRRGGEIDPDEAVKMRLSGQTYADIGRRWGVSRQAAFQVVGRLLCR